MSEIAFIIGLGFGFAGGFYIGVIAAINFIKKTLKEALQDVRRTVQTKRNRE